MPMACKANDRPMRTHASAFGLRNLPHPLTAPSQARILLRRLLDLHRRILRAVLLSIGPRAQEMLWRSGLCCL